MSGRFSFSPEKAWPICPIRNAPPGPVGNNLGLSFGLPCRRGRRLRRTRRNYAFFDRSMNREAAADRARNRCDKDTNYTNCRELV